MTLDVCGIVSFLKDGEAALSFRSWPARREPWPGPST
jgi:hypothetical protein